MNRQYVQKEEIVLVGSKALQSTSTIKFYFHLTPPLHTFWMNHISWAERGGYHRCLMFLPFKNDTYWKDELKRKITCKFMYLHCAGLVPVKLINLEVTTKDPPTQSHSSATRLCDQIVFQINTVFGSGEYRREMWCSRQYVQKQERDLVMLKARQQSNIRNHAVKFSHLKPPFLTYILKEPHLLGGTRWLPSLFGPPPL